MKYEIWGRVLEAESGRGVSGVIVRAFDKDLLFDDLLAEVMPNLDGMFFMEYTEARFKDLFDKTPDIYITVKTTSGKTIYTTEKATRFNATPREIFRILIPRETLRDAGVSPAVPAPPVPPETLKGLSCLNNRVKDDDLVKQIERDLAGKSSVLEMMKGYMVDLQGRLDNDALSLKKLQRLFELGSTPNDMSGHHFGVMVGLRPDNLTGPLALVKDQITNLWGATIGAEGGVAWVGKTFLPMTTRDRKLVVAATVPNKIPVFRGINHFNIPDITAAALSDFVSELMQIPEVERLKYGHELSYGSFAAHKAFSIYEKTPREVLWLNYRFPALGNLPPFSYFIDEVVEITDGFYLGQIMLPTERLLEQYDPQAEPETYGYRLFGYFLIFREEWNAEARRLFPHLDMPAAAATSPLVLGDGERAS